MRWLKGVNVSDHRDDWTKEEFIEQTRSMFEAYADSNEWTEEDFNEPPSVDDVMDDPWSISPKRTDRPATTNLPTEDHSISESRDTLSAEDGSRASSSHLEDRHVTKPQTEGEYPALSEETDWEYDDLYLDEHDGLDDHISNLDEPEPQAEYDSDLSQTLYESDPNIPNLTLRLRVDEFIASIEYTTDSHRDEIIEALNELSGRRLSHFLRWTKQKQWTGHSLLLFIKFRAVWDDNPDWWEYIVWNAGLDTLQRYSNPSTLSRDACYELIHSRLHCGPHEIIDEHWYEDWDNFVLWKRGFPSFTSFALFRAGLKDREDWWSLLDFTNNVEETLNDSFPEVYKAYKGGYITAIVDSLTDNHRVVDDYTPFRRPYGPPQWFAIQDYYDPVEWHDSLGWPNVWIESTHPYMFPESSDSISIYEKLMKEG